jgi:two-component system response regulator ResD
MLNRRVLIVEDDPAVRQIVRVLLERDGIEVDVAEDGERAVALLAEKTYATVLLDLLLPRLDGRAVIEFMRQHALETPVVVLTAVTVSTDLDPSVVRVVLQKPFEARELRKVVNAVLERV